jgi:hypothetical protein
MTVNRQAEINPSRRERSLEEALASYATGANFDPNLFVSVTRIAGERPIFESREAVLESYCRGKKVLHVGFADHLPLVQEKTRSGNWLHGRLNSVSSELHGVDTNIQAISDLQALGWENLYSWADLNIRQHFDVVICSDVIEHIENQAHFLAQLRNLSADRFVFTTPNAFRMSNRFAFRGESVNSDHVVWFSPYTLGATLTRAGFQVEKLTTADYFGFSRPISSSLKILFPLLRDTLVVEAV